jgi:hypothetical protein
MRRCKCSGREVLEPHKLGLVCKRGCVFFRGEGDVLALRGTCQKYVLRNFLLYVNCTNLLVDTVQCRLTSCGEESLVTEAECKNTLTFSFFGLFHFRSKNNEEGRCTAHECSAEHVVSVGHCV